MSTISNDSGHNILGLVLRKLVSLNQGLIKLTTCDLVYLHRARDLVGLPFQVYVIGIPRNAVQFKISLYPGSLEQNKVTRTFFGWRGGEAI